VQCWIEMGSIDSMGTPMSEDLEFLRIGEVMVQYDLFEPNRIGIDLGRASIGESLDAVQQFPFHSPSFHQGQSGHGVQAMWYPCQFGRQHANGAGFGGMGMDNKGFFPS